MVKILKQKREDMNDEKKINRMNFDLRKQRHRDMKMRWFINVFIYQLLTDIHGHKIAN